MTDPYHPNPTKASDLVERLEHCPPFSVNDCRQAAAELRSLRAQLAAAEARATDYCEIVKREFALRLAAEAQLKIAIEALRFYADPFAWKGLHDPENDLQIPDFYSETSFGDTAIVALRSLTEGDGND